MPTGRIYAGSNIPVMRTYSDVNWMSTYKGRTRSYSFTRTVNFKVALDSSDFKMIATNEKLSTIDKINTSSSLCLRKLKLLLPSQ